MIGKLMAAGAVALLLGSTAFAAAPAPAATAATATSATTLASGYTMAANDAVASRVIGAGVYDSTAADAHQIGTIKDLVFDQAGNIHAAVIGVGGFLGVGEKNVAVDYTSLHWATAQDGSLRATLDATKDALNAAPAFVYPAQNNGVATTAPVAAQPANTVATTAPVAAQPAGNANANNAALTSNSGNATAPAATRAEVDPSTLTAMTPDKLKTDDLKGTDVISTTGEKLGSINDFVLDKDGKVDAVIVDFGGFLGIGTKQVAIAYQGLKFLSDKDNKHYLEVNVSKDQLNAQAGYNKDTYATDRDKQRMVVSS